MAFSFDNFIRAARESPGSLVEAFVPELVPGFSLALKGADFLGDVFTQAFSKAVKPRFATREVVSDQLQAYLATQGIRFEGNIRFFEGGPIYSTWQTGYSPARIDLPLPPVSFPGPEAVRQISAEEHAMAFNLAPFLQGVSGIFGSAGQALNNPFLQAAGNIGSAFTSAFTPQPQMMQSFAPAPVFQPMQQMQATPVMASAVPAIKATSALAVQVGMILSKVAVRFGVRNLSLAGALRRIRSLGKMLEPTVVAAAVGLTAAELASLIVAGQSRKHRRTNPANVKALRRSLRRLESFHRLCVRVDSLRKPRSRGRVAPFRRRKSCK